MSIFGVHVCMDEINMLIFSIPHANVLVPWFNSVIARVFG